MIDIAIEPLRDVLERRDLCRQIVSAGRGFFEHADSESERSQLLAELIVHLACDAAPLVFLCKHHPAKQLGARTLAALPFARLFCLLALSEIEMRADDAYDRAVGFAAHRESARKYLDVVTLLMTQPEFHLVGRVASGNGGIHTDCARQVVGMNEPLECADVRLDFVILVAKHALPVRRVDHRTGLEVPVVDTLLRARECQRQPLLALAECRLGTFPLGQIEMRADNAYDRTAGFA